MPPGLWLPSDRVGTPTEGRVAVPQDANASLHVRSGVSRMVLDLGQGRKQIVVVELAHAVNVPLLSGVSPLRSVRRGDRPPIRCRR